MKIIYSQLQKLLPSLKNVDPKTVASRLSWLGHFANSIESTPTDTIINLEVRQNRGECLGYFGIASDLSPLYGPLNIKSYQTIPDKSLPATPVTINSKDVLRIQSLSISNIKNIPSPPWLKTFLNNHDINSINCLVDLSNYIMLLYGIPCHTFNADKVNHRLTWQNNTNFSSFTSLDGTVIDIQKQNLLITNDKEVVSLSFIGGKNSGVDLNTTNTIIEMAVYNRSRVRSDSRGLKTITEASTRLDKYLDCNLVPLAFSHLKQIILDILGGTISTKLLDYYPTPQESPIIKFDTKKVSSIAGIKINDKFSIQTLEKIGCQYKRHSESSSESIYLVTPPTIRKDINIEEDLIEEVIRYFGYDNIPTDAPISDNKLNDITPKIIYLIKSLKDTLVSLGYNEVRSWPLIQKKHILKNLLKKDQQIIYTQNSINQQYPVLRHTIISSLQNQFEQYKKYKLDDTSFFEIGNIFYQQGNDYIEKYSLGIFSPYSDKLQTDLDKIDLGDPDHVIKNNSGLFIEYILNNKASKAKTQTYDKTDSHAAIELTRQIVTLDANLTLSKKIDSNDLINEYSQKIGKHLWQMKITDIYHNTKDNTYKYTFRVSYYNLSSAKSKKLHLDTFNLN